MLLGYEAIVNGAASPMNVLRVISGSTALHKLLCCPVGMKLATAWPIRSLSR
jgi:hypothetical protein